MTSGAQTALLLRNNWLDLDGDEDLGSVCYQLKLKGAKAAEEVLVGDLRDATESASLRFSGRELRS